MEEEAGARPVSVVEESPSRNVTREVDEGREAEEQQQTSLVDIHRQVLSRIVSFAPNSNESSVASLQHRLDTLKRKRLYLESELARKRVSLTNVSEELLHTHKNQRTRDCRGSNDHEFVVAERRMALRIKRRIAASHRLAGISVVPRAHDANVLGIRLDICVAGTYVNRHYLFFQQQEARGQEEKDKEGHKDIEKEEQDKQDEETTRPQEEQKRQSRHFKLVQHTLPQGVLFVIEDRTVELSLDALQHYIGNVYDACYSHAVRQDVVDCVKSQAEAGATEVDCNNALDCISFQLQCGDENVRVVLHYTDSFSSLPTNVKVTRVAPASQPVNPATDSDNVVEVVSSEDEDDTILNTARTAFRTCSFREALKKIENLSTA